ncbi:MAG: dynamin family protein [Clostridium sp.]
MNSIREDFNEKKLRVIKVVLDGVNLFEKYGDKNYYDNFKHIYKSLLEDEFSIVLVGEFSSGKSTFLNALMGDRILPSYTTETTATINYLKHKEKSPHGEEGKVYFNDGSFKLLEKVNSEGIKRYTTTDSYEDVVKKISHMDIYLDSIFLEGNLTLVDTPGLKGIADGHREITEEEIKRAHACIFMFKSNQPGSNTDFEFLKDIKSKFNTIIFVLNKIDSIKESEGETPQKIINEIKERYKQKFPNERTIPEIWGVSAYEALVARSDEKLEYNERDDYSINEKRELLKSSRICQFEDRLWKFITKGEKARETLMSPLTKLINTLNEVKRKSEDEIDILSGRVESIKLQESITRLRDKIDEINREVSYASSKIVGDLDLTIYEIEENIEVMFDKVKDNNILKLTNWTDLDELLEYENNIIVKGKIEYKKIIQKGEKTFIRKVKEIISKYYIDISEEINSKLREDSLIGDINLEYNPNEVELNINIEEYEKDIKDLEENLIIVENKLINSDENLIKIRRLKREKDLLREHIINTESQIEALKNIMPPQREYINDHITKSIKREGILGNIEEFFQGPRKVDIIERKITNEEEILEFKQEKERRIYEYKLKLSSLTNRLNSFKDFIKGEDDEEVENKRLQDEENKIKRRIEDEQNAFKEVFLKKNKVALRNRKFEIESYFDELSTECMYMIKEELSKKKNIYVDLIKWVIQNDLKRKLSIKNEELQLLETKLKSSKEERELLIEDLKRVIAKCNTIIKESTSIKDEVQGEEINYIEQVDL